MSGTDSTRVITRNNRSFTCQDKKTLKKQLNYLVTTESFPQLVQTNPSYKDVYMTLNMWITHRVELRAAHATVTEFNANKYSPWHQPQSLMLDLVIYYEHENEYYVNLELI